MPSRKRARLSPSAASASTSTPAPSSPPRASRRSGRTFQSTTVLPATSSAASSPAVLSASDSAPQSPASLPWVPDQWTPAQETALFKAVIRHKPTGMHKHFNMISISSYLQSHGHAYPVLAQTPPATKPNAPSKKTRTTAAGQSFDSADNEDAYKHTSIPGIWQKLEELYNLTALDEKENINAFGGPVAADPDWPFEDFSLPGDTLSHGQDSSDYPAATNFQRADRHAEEDDAENDNEYDEQFYKSEMWARRFPKPDEDSDDAADSNPADEGSRSGSPYSLPVRRGPDGLVTEVPQSMNTLPQKSGGNSKKVGGPSSSSARPSTRKNAVSTLVSDPNASTVTRRSRRRDAGTRTSATPPTEDDPADQTAEEQVKHEGASAEDDDSGQEEDEDEQDNNEEEDADDEDEEQDSERSSGETEDEDEDEIEVEAEEAGTKVESEDEAEQAAEEGGDDGEEEEEESDGGAAMATRSTRSSARTRRK